MQRISASQTIARGLRAVSVVIVAAVVSEAMAADLNTEVNSMFTSLGTIGNYTAPGAFKGQTMNTYYGGSFFMRAPQKKYTLFQFRLPSMKGGCGGIDAHMGSFSHISGAEFKSLLQGITSALPGIAFQAALEVVSPLLGDITKYATQLNEWANKFNKGSCELAKMGAGAFADSMGWTTDKACVGLANNFLGMDQTESERKCKVDKAAVLNDGETSADPAKKALTPFAGNFMWAALKKVNDIDDAERELIMNVTGTVVYPSATTEQQPKSYEPRLKSVNTLLRGDADGAAPSTIRLDLWKCDDYTSCMNPTVQSVEFTPFTVLVENRMMEILNAIQTRTAVPNNSLAVGFIQRTSLPVLKMLSIGSAIPNSGIAESMIARYRDVIAADYAYLFLDRYVSGAIKALGQSFELNDAQKAKAEEVRAAPREMKRLLAAEMAKVEARSSALAAITVELEGAQRQMRASLPSQITDMLGYQAKGIAR